jgi:hypothetical protein
MKNTASVHEHVVQLLSYHHNTANLIIHSLIVTRDPKVGGRIYFDYDFTWSRDAFILSTISNPEGSKKKIVQEKNSGYSFH